MAKNTVVHPASPAPCPLPLGMRVPEIPPFKLMPAIPFIPSRPNRGPKTGPLKSEGFLLGNCRPATPGQLPKLFALPVRDYAMAPMLMPGELAHFSTEETPEPGDCVLVGTTFGPDIRQYDLISDTEWAGCALHPEYEHILSTEEPMWVIGVLVGAELDVRRQPQPEAA